MIDDRNPDPTPKPIISNDPLEGSVDPKAWNSGVVELQFVAQGNRTWVTQMGVEVVLWCDVYCN